MHTNSSKTTAKNIFHYLIVVFMLLALIFGIVFSSVSVSRGVKLGAQYRGGFQAVVGVYDVNQNSEEEKGLPNGNAKKGASILQDKMSPFSDGSINISIDGKNRLLVTAPRDSYSDNQQLFKNAIQSTGGLFIFDDKYKDLMLSSLVKKAGLSEELKNKAATSELLGQVKATSRKVGGISNRPYVEFALDNDKLEKIAAPESAENPGSSPRLSFVVDTNTVLDSIRNYFMFANQAKNHSDLDTYLQTFISTFLEPLDKIVTATDSKKLTTEERAVLEDF